MMVSEEAPFTRDEICQHLEKSGVETRPVLAGNILRQPAMKSFPAIFRRKLSGADEVHKRGFYIGLSPMHEAAAMRTLRKTFLSFLERYE